MSEVEPTAGQRHRRPGRLILATILAAILLLSIAIAAAAWAHGRALRARFLTVTADSVPDDKELMNFALPRGASAYAEHCAFCHGAHLRGDPTLAVFYGLILVLMIAVGFILVRPGTRSWFALASRLRSEHRRKPAP